MPERRPPSRAPERAALIGLVSGSSRRLAAEQSLEELAGLAQAAGAEVALRMLQERPKPDPATFIGSGKVASLAAACDEADVDVVIVDAELTQLGGRELVIEHDDVDASLGAGGGERSDFAAADERRRIRLRPFLKHA